MTSDSRYLLLQLQQACQQARWDTAELALRQLLRQDPQQPLSFFAQGYYQQARGQLSQAGQSFEQALSQDPAFGEARSALIKIETRLGQNLRAIELLEQQLQQDPWQISALKQWVSLNVLCGRHTELQAMGQSLLNPEFARRLQAQVGSAEVQSFQQWQPQLEALLLLSRFAQDGSTPELMPGLISSWWQRYRQQRRPPGPGYANPARLNKILRIGYVSREWGLPPLELGFSQLFAQHNPERFCLIAYCDQGRPRQSELFERWHLSADWDDYRFYQQVQTDRIDILVDLSGFFNPSRLLSLAYKPAPVQILAGANPPFASGLESIDVVFSQSALLPSEIRQLYPEQFIDQDCFFYWAPPASSPAVSPLPLAEHGFLTLGIVASPNKITTASLKLWAQTLEHLPTARLRLKNQCYAEAAMRHWISQRYLAAGGRAEQLEFEDNRQRSDLFSFLAEVDLLLDTTPYAGALSSCDALWMGVPVVSLSGGQRIADSIAATLKLEDFLARSPEHFAELVRQLASQPEVLSGWRQRLRARLRASAFCQGAQQAQSAEAAYDKLWQQWCQANRGN